MNISLNLLSIKILLSCSKNKISKRDISQHYKRHPINNRNLAINELLQEKLIREEFFVSDNSKKPTTYYFATELGKDWLATYYKN